VCRQLSADEIIMTRSRRWVTGVAFGMLFTCSAAGAAGAATKSDAADTVMTALAQRQATRAERTCGTRIVGARLMRQLAVAVLADAEPTAVQDEAVGRLMFECLGPELRTAMARGLGFSFEIEPGPAACVAARLYAFMATIPALRTGRFDSKTWVPAVQQRAIAAIRPCVATQALAEQIVLT
jgi:hypothetical protein